MESNTDEVSAAPASLKEAKQRLMTLAHFLMRGQLSHEQFNFNVFNVGGSLARPCGHTGCAIGELPACFPEHWQFGKSGCWTSDFAPKLIGQFADNPITDAATFFGVSRRAATMLFSRDLDGATDWPLFLTRVPAALFTNYDTEFDHDEAAAFDSDVERVFVAANLAEFANHMRYFAKSLDELKLFLVKDVEHDEEEENAAGG